MTKREDLKLIVTTTGTGLHVGDIIYITPFKESKFKRLLKLFIKPRLRYVKSIISSTEFEVGERRMTWVEWRTEILQIFSV